MNRDPAKVGRAKVSAHTMAIIINSFIDPISWKAIVRDTDLVLAKPLLTISADVLPGNHLDRYCRQQLVIPLLQEPPEPARLFATPQVPSVARPITPRPAPPTTAQPVLWLLRPTRPAANTSQRVRRETRRAVDAGEHTANGLCHGAQP